MKSAFNRVFFSALIALAVIASPLLASSSYTATVTHQTSVNIAGTTHGLGCVDYSVVVRISGVRQPASSYTLTKDAMTYDATVTWPAYFSGTVQLQGCWSVTGSSGDFLLEIYAGDIRVCRTCTDAAYAARHYSGSGYAMPYSAKYAITATSSGTLRVWLDPDSGELYFGVTGSVSVGPVTCDQVGCSAHHVQSVTAFPAGAIQIGTASYSGGAWSSVVDLRPF